MELFSPAQENKRPAVALQLGLFSPLQFGLFQPYEVEWRTCRVNLQLGFVQPCRRELKARRWLSGLDFFGPLQYWTLLVLQNRMESLQSGSAVWSSSVLQKRIKDLQCLCSLDFFSPLQFGPFYSPMSRMKSLQSGSAERTKGLQTYGVALQFGQRE